MEDWLQNTEDCVVADAEARSVFPVQQILKLLSHNDHSPSKVVVQSTQIKCTTCNLQFPDAAALRAHAKSPLHVHNSRAAYHGEKVVASLDELEESKGSSSNASSFDLSDVSSSDTESEPDEQLQQDEIILSAKSNSILFVWRLTDGSVIEMSVLRVWLLPSSQKEEAISESIDSFSQCIPSITWVQHRHAFCLYRLLRGLRESFVPRSLPQSLDPPAVLCAVLMCSGGKFSGSVYALSQFSQDFVSFPHPPCSDFVRMRPRSIAHKSVSFYTSRKKQGGSQLKVQVFFW